MYFFFFVRKGTIEMADKTESTSTPPNKLKAWKLPDIVSIVRKITNTL